MLHVPNLTDSFMISVSVFKSLSFEFSQSKYIIMAFTSIQYHLLYNNVLLEVSHLKKKTDVYIDLLHIMDKICMKYQTF